MKNIKLKHMEWQLSPFLMSIHLSSWHEDLYSSSNERKNEILREIWAFCIKNKEETSKHKKIRKKKKKSGSKEKRILLEVTSTLLCALGKLNGPGLGVLWQHFAWLSLHILPHCCF